MHIFTLLGIILDNICEEDTKITLDNGDICFLINDVDIINKYILPLCDDDECYRIADEGDWYVSTLNFSKDKHGKEILQSIRIENSTRDYKVCKVGANIISWLANNFMLPTVYYAMCKEIMS